MPTSVATRFRQLPSEAISAKAPLRRSVGIPNFLPDAMTDPGSKDEEPEDLWKILRPLPDAQVGSWTHTQTDQVRSTLR